MQFRFRIAVLALVAPLCLAGAVRTAHAQYLGQFGPLNRMGTNQKSLGVYLGAGPRGLATAVEGRVNQFERGTLGVQMTVDHGLFGAQLDVRSGLLGTSGDFPLMLGGELAGGLFTGNGDTGIYGQLVPGLSWEMDAGEGQSWAAWAGLGFRVNASKHKIGWGESLLRVGGRFGFSTQLGLAATLEDVAGNSHLLVGAEYRFGGHGDSNVPGGK